MCSSFDENPCIDVRGVADKQWQPPLQNNDKVHVLLWETPKIQPKKKSSGIRKYTPGDIENIQLIHYLLKEKGMTIDGAKNHLKTAKKKEKGKIQLLNRLEKIKTQLVALRNNL